MAAIDRLFVRVQQRGASDLHLSEGQPPRIRRHGKMETVPNEPLLEGSAIEALLKEISPADAREKCERTGDSVFAYSLDPQRRFRVSSYKHVSGRGAVCRMIPRQCRRWPIWACRRFSVSRPRSVPGWC
jgi:twitching motility protein PilT